MADMPIAIAAAGQGSAATPSVCSPGTLYDDVRTQVSLTCAEWAIFDHIT